MHLPAIRWKRPPRKPSDLELYGVYLALPGEAPVYATLLMDDWYLIGEERSFAVAEDGAVREITEGADTEPTMTLEDFDPTFEYMSQCREHGVLNDWSHAEHCGE